MFQQDVQWWAGAIAAAVLAAVAVVSFPHPYDGYATAVGAGLAAFAMYKVTPGDSVKKD